MPTGVGPRLPPVGPRMLDSSDSLASLALLDLTTAGLGRTTMSFHYRMRFHRRRVRALGRTAALALASLTLLSAGAPSGLSSAHASTLPGGAGSDRSRTAPLARSDTTYRWGS